MTIWNASAGWNAPLEEVPGTHAHYETYVRPYEELNADPHLMNELELQEVMNDPTHPRSEGAIHEFMARRQLEEEQLRPQAVDSVIISEPEQPNLSDQEKTALVIHFLSTTIIPLELVDEDDYGHKCRYCDEMVRPIAEGPQHESGCQRRSPHLKYDADASHKYKCTHCDARPFVAGFHHRPDCPRGFPAITLWEVQNSDYKHKCDCGVRPISEGPHHSSSCEHHAEIPLFHTERAHEYYCTHCEAKPFIAGPHHKEDCQRHMDEIAIPIGLLTNNS
jgi:hypothetical protein